MSDFLIDEITPKYNMQQDSVKDGSESPISSSASSEESAAGSNSASASINSIPDDSSNPELMMARYMPKIPEDHEILAEGFHTWHIDSWKDLKAAKVSGPRFKIGEFEWNLLLFPKGNGGVHLSTYLEPHPPSKVAVDLQDNSEPIEISDDDNNINDNNDNKTQNGVKTSNDVNEINIDTVDTVETKENENNVHLVVPLDPNWHVCAQFVIDIWNPKFPSTHKHNVSQHRFSSEENDWGFGNFVELSHLHSPSRLYKHPFVHEDKVNFTVYVRIIKDHTGVLWHNFVNYDSKKETGFVGINNQGATCYLNSLLQSYYFTKLFRKKVYQIPTQDETVTLDDGEEVTPESKSVSLLLQRLFYRLQTSKEAVDTNELTLSFGWDSSELFTQHDVQEMNRILMDRLENKMKGTEIEGCLSDIFVGKMKSFIRCIKVEYESSRIEDFWDIQLNVKGMKDLRESFANYIELETLTGENQYDASGYGLQDAEKGVVFEEFPPVLHLQLKRFEYDFNFDQLVKVNDRHEFTSSIDLKPFLDPHGANLDADWTYDLHGVLVHTGDISTGHYYALIKPSSKDEWFRFDDDRVWKVTPHAVFEENFGCDRKSELEIRAMTRAEQFAYQNRRHTSLYMLVYIRRSHLAQVLDEVAQQDIPRHIPLQVDKEELEKERKRKEREEMHLYLNFKVITNTTFMHYQGFDLAPDENSKLYYANDVYDDDSYPVTFRLLKTCPASELFEVVSKVVGGLSAKQFRLWIVMNRKNTTIRPELPIDLDVDFLEDVTIEDIVEQRAGRKPAVFTLYVEEIHKSLTCVSKWIIEQARVQQGAQFDVNNLSSSAPDIDSTSLIAHYNAVLASIPLDKYPQAFAEIDVDSQDILLLLKYYDLERQSLRGVGHVVVNRDSITGSLVKYIQVLMNWSFDTEVVLYEEVQPTSVDAIDTAMTFGKHELQSGDILCFAKASTLQSSALEFPSIPSFYRFLRHRVHLSIKPLQKTDQDTGEYQKQQEIGKYTTEFDLWVIGSISFKELARKIGARIDADPDYIRIFGVYSNETRLPIASHTQLQQLLTKTVPQASLFNFEYEIMNIPLLELENMKSLKIYWISSGVVHCQKHELLIPKNGTVKDLMEKILTKFKLDDAQLKSVFIYTTMSHRISHVLNPDILISPIDSSRFTIYLGAYPEIYAANGLGNNQDEHLRLQTIRNSIDPLIVKEISFPTQIADIRTTYVFQFYKDFNSRHGVPFVFILIKGEKFKYTKLRLQQKVGLGAKEFSKIKVAVSPLYGDWKPKYLLDDTTELFDELDVEDHLALDHPDRSVRRGSNFERAIFIKD